MSLPSAPWMQVAIDTVGPLHTTRHGNKYIICMVDYFTRYCEAQAVEEQSTHTVLRAVYNQVICRHGVPQVLISDRGSPYVSEVAKQMFNRLGITRHYSSAYHPQSNGAVERFNRTLKETLRVWANENADDWDDLLPFALFSYNSAYHSTIKNTPFFLEHGRMPRMPLDVQLGRADVRDRHPAWRLLASPHAPLVASFLHRVFVAPNVRVMSEADLAEALEDCASRIERIAREVAGGK
jgi:transposase InsO family protein